MSAKEQIELLIIAIDLIKTGKYKNVQGKAIKDITAKNIQLVYDEVLEILH